MTEPLVPPPAQPHRRRTLALLGLLAALPAVFLTWLVVTHWVNVPHWDQWDEVHHFVKAGEGTYTLGDLLSQQNESRPIVPRLWFIAFSLLTHWDVRFEMACSILLSALLSGLLYRQALATVSADKARVLCLMVPVNLFVFTPVMHENWLIGYYMQIFIPGLCMLGCIRVAHSRLAPARAFLACLALTLVATFSFSSGILLWITAYLVQRLRDAERPTGVPGGTRAGRRLRAGLWFGLAALTLVLYFHGYKKPPTHPAWSKALEHPFLTVHYALVFLGGPLGPALPFEKVPADTVMGAAFVFGWLVAAALLLRFRHDRDLRRRAWGWVALGVYAFGCAGTTAIGRVGFSVFQATSSRYSVHALLGWIALLFLGVILFDHAKSRCEEPARRARMSFAGWALAGALLLGQGLCVPYALGNFAMIRDHRLRGKAALELALLVPDNPNARLIYPFYEWLRTMGDRLDRLGYLDPPLVRASDLGTVEAPGNMAYGELEKVEFVHPKRVKISGWARLPDRGEPADAVVLTYIDATGRAVPFVLATTRIYRLDLKMSLGSECYWGSGWTFECDVDELPAAVRKGNAGIQAWAFDGLARQARRLFPVRKLPEAPE